VPCVKGAAAKSRSRSASSLMSVPSTATPHDASSRCRAHFRDEAAPTRLSRGGRVPARPGEAAPVRGEAAPARPSEVAPARGEAVPAPARLRARSAPARLIVLDVARAVRVMRKKWSFFKKNLLTWGSHMLL
jgi:hypothetical protein